MSIRRRATAYSEKSSARRPSRRRISLRKVSSQSTFSNAAATSPHRFGIDVNGSVSGRFAVEPRIAQHHRQPGPQRFDHGHDRSLDFGVGQVDESPGQPEQRRQVFGRKFVDEIHPRGHVALTGIAQQEVGIGRTAAAHHNSDARCGSGVGRRFRRRPAALRQRRRHCVPHPQRTHRRRDPPLRRMYGHCGRHLRPTCRHRGPRPQWLRRLQRLRRFRRFRRFRQFRHRRLERSRPPGGHAPRPAGANSATMFRFASGVSSPTPRIANPAPASTSPYPPTPSDATLSRQPAFSGFRSPPPSGSRTDRATVSAKPPHPQPIPHSVRLPAPRFAPQHLLQVVPRSAPRFPSRVSAPACAPVRSAARTSVRSAAVGISAPRFRASRAPRSRSRASASNSTS